MSPSAKDRLQSLANHLSPPIIQVAPSPSAPRLINKVIIITGANSPIGIGRASAYAFASQSPRAIYICDFDSSHLASHKAEINEAFPDVEVHTKEFDAADEKAVKEVVDDAVRRYGRLDVFFANAGIVGPMSVFEEVEGDELMEVVRVNTLR
jgi:NAD(P)-dependent dehydrogenase (short-subunit alcohol dehydrogenase family)